MRSFFTLLPWFFLFLIPSLAMRTWSDEKRSGTIETLLTLPYSQWQIIAAKYVSGLLFIIIVLLFSLPFPITLSRIGNLDVGQVVGQYLASFFLGAVIFALGQWLSSLTKNQIVSFILTIAASFVLIVIGLSFFTNSTGILGTVFQNISLLTHYQNMARGVIELRDIVYFLSFIGLFLYLNAYSLVSRNWK